MNASKVKRWSSLDECGQGEKVRPRSSEDPASKASFPSVLLYCCCVWYLHTRWRLS